jgi:hypothetical protein
MEVLMRKPFDFIALANNDVGLLSVVCGTSAIFEVRVSMPRRQLDELLADDAQLKRLLVSVRESPSRYSGH